LSQTYSFISRDHIEHVALCIEVVFGLDWRDIYDGAKQVPVVEPIDPAEGGHFQVLHVAPRSLAVDQLSFVEAVNRFGEGVVVAVTDAADRLFDVSFGQTISVANGQILPAHYPAGHCATMSREGRSE
tara:strand:+ start:101 stop:484 length:384 start_codon:yes stop_codon:yes gene_type:complete